VLSHRYEKQIRETNITAWRRTVSGDLTSIFRPFQEGTAVPFPPRDAFLEQIHRAQFTRLPSGYRKLSAEDVALLKEDSSKVSWMPQQEPGVRPSAALPYELAASGALSADGKRFELVLEARNSAFGKAAAGAPFHVYTPRKFRDQSKLRTRAYAVAAGDRLTDTWDLDGFEKRSYHLRVCGPNGFLREFAGNHEDPHAAIEFDYARDHSTLTGDINLRIASHSEDPLTLQVKDHGYRTGNHTLVVQPGREGAVTLRLAQSHHWYDFSVTILGADRFFRRFAGRVETGRPGFSDPVMGRVLV